MAQTFADRYPRLVIINDDAEMNGTVDGDIEARYGARVHITGTVLGTLRVARGAVAEVTGTVGTADVAAGATMRLAGTVMTDLVNRGSATITGTVAGQLTNLGGVVDLTDEGRVLNRPRPATTARDTASAASAAASVSPVQTARMTLSRPLLVVLFICFLDILGTTILTPSIVFIVRRYTNDALTVAAMTAAFSAAQFFAAPLLGSLSDIFGRRPVLLASLIGSVVGYAMFGFGGGLAFLILARIIAGLAGGNISTASAAIVDMTPPTGRVRIFGYLGAAFGLGYVVGPVIAAGLINVSYTAPAFAAGGLSLAAVIATYFLFGETFPRERRTRHTLHAGALNPFGPFRQLWPSLALRRLYATQALFVFAFIGVASILPVLYLDRLHASPALVTGQFVVSGLATAIVQLFLAGPLCDRFGERSVTRGALVALALCYPLYLLVGQLDLAPLLYATNVISGGSSALVFTTIGAMVASCITPENRGKASGVSTSVLSLMTAVAPLTLGLAYDSIGWATPLALGLVTAVAASLILGSGILRSALAPPDSTARGRE